MLNYATVGSNDLVRAKTFYDALLIPLGMEKLFDHPSGGRIYGRFGKGAFGVLGPYDGGTACVGNGVTIGFQFDTLEELKAFHKRALELGGTNEGDPGPRGGESSPLNFAYFRDPDGNKLCGYYLVPREKR
jgi:catechol 2,3-dioxygenase-like lactoylglutathione lyase family enzyme